MTKGRAWTIGWGPATVVLLLAGGCAAGRGGGDSGAQLRLAGRGIATINGVPLEVMAGPEFRRVSPTDRLAAFGGRPYGVSLAALLGQDEAVMIHGERVLDGSGASNYDDLPRAAWPSPMFGLREYCMKVTGDMATAEHDLAWLARNGWDPVGMLAVRQYLATSADHNREAVLSLIVRPRDCTDGAALNARFAALQAKLRVR